MFPVFRFTELWGTEDAQTTDFKASLLAHASRWLASPDTQVEKSGPLEFGLDGLEVTAIRRVAVTSIDGVEIPTSVSNVALVQSAQFSELHIEIDSFENGANVAHDSQALSATDHSFLTDLRSILPTNTAHDVVVYSSSQQVFAALENPSRYRFLVLVGPSAVPADHLDALLPLSTDFGTVCDVGLIDAPILTELNEELGITFSIPMGGARFFAPGFDIENALDARRHPAVAQLVYDDSTGRLQLNDSKLRRVKAVCIANATSEPRNETSNFVFKEVRTRFLDATSEKIAKLNSAALLRQSSNTIEFEARLEKLTDDLNHALGWVESVEQKSREDEIALQDLNTDLFVTYADLDHERRTNAFLRRELALLGHYGSAEPPAIDLWSEIPDTFVELVVRCTEIAYIRFSGSAEPCQQLDTQPRTEVPLQRAWYALRSLSDYARLKESGSFDGNFHAYIKSGDHPGYKIGISAIAMSEGEQVNVNPGLRSSREFPVPEEVSAGGTAFMESHIKLATGISNSPRMHFLDNTGGDGLIYIGYIGRHLPNTRTN